MKILPTALSVLALSVLALSFTTPRTSGASATEAHASRSEAESYSAETESYSVDPVHSSVVFSTLHLGVSRFYGRFNQVSGEVKYDEAQPESSSILIVIAADSVDTNSENRDRHLKSDDFLSTNEFPEISFESTKLEKRGDALAVTGTLSLHGKEKEITAEARVIGSGDTMFGDYRRGFEAHFTVDMRDFGIAFVEKNPSGVGPEVELIISLECVRS